MEFYLERFSVLLCFIKIVISVISGKVQWKMNEALSSPHKEIFSEEKKIN